MEHFLHIVNWLNANPSTVSAIATVVIAVTAGITVWLTWSLVQENRILRKAGTESRVVAYLKIHPRFNEVINFALANVGQGAACNVRFQLEANEKDFAFHGVSLRNETGRATIGILPPGDKLEMHFGFGDPLLQEPRLRPFQVTVEYEDIGGNLKTDTYSLDVSQFAEWSTMGEPTDHEMAEALKKIEKHLDNCVSGLLRLKVETMTAAEVKRESRKAQD